MKRGPKVKSLAERFWKFIRKTSSCWLWTGHLNTHGGHGQITIHGNVQWPAHKAAYLLYHGSIPEGMKILHTCDVPTCVRKEHLYAGTNADNTRDMMTRGRCRWTGAGIKKLSPARRRKLGLLASRGLSVRGLAKKFGVSISTVKHWKAKVASPSESSWKKIKRRFCDKEPDRTARGRRDREPSRGGHRLPLRGRSRVGSDRAAPRRELAGSSDGEGMGQVPGEG